MPISTRGARPSPPATAIDPKAAEIAHLLRRAGLGAHPAELGPAIERGYEATVASLVGGAVGEPLDDSPAPPPDLAKTPPVDPAQFGALHGWWLERLATTSRPLRERMTLLWHNHFATAIRKVKAAGLMLEQNETIRRMAMGAFPELVHALAKDPAMLLWLDSNSNKKGAPNENFARELMELFTLGIGAYSEKDVREASRAFTGWELIRRQGVYQLNTRQHDTGFKTVLGVSGGLTGEQVIDIVTTQPASARFVTSAIWDGLAGAPLPAATADRLASHYASWGRSVSAVVGEVLVSPEFRAPDAQRVAVRSPVDWAVAAARALKLGAKINDIGAVAARRRGPLTPVMRTLAGMSQLLFNPPNVGGWGTGRYWLTTAAAEVKLAAAPLVAGLVESPERFLEPPAAPVPIPIRGSMGAALMANLGHPDAGRETIAALDGFLGTSPTSAPNPATARNAIALALVSPDFQVA